VRHESSPVTLSGRAEIVPTVAAVSAKVAAVSPAIPKVIAKILAVATKVPPFRLGRLPVAALDILAELLAVRGDVAPIGPDVPGVASDVAPILTDIPGVLPYVLGSHEGSPQPYHERSACQHPDQSLHGVSFRDS
jgi:hypothetical protein